MNYEFLVEEITKLVMAEIEKVSQGSPMQGGSGDAARVLVVLDDETEDIDSIFDVLSKVAGTLPNYQIYIPSHLVDLVNNNGQYLRFTPIYELKRHQFKTVVAGVDRVVIPFVSVTSLTKTANLIGDEPVPGLCIKALMEGKPVTVCTDGIHSLGYSGLKTDSKIMNMIQANLKTLEELGIETVQINKLKENIGIKPEEPVQAAVGVKNVVTNDDVMIAYNQGQKVLNFPRGTIITPLARETAEAMGMEINLV